MHELFDFIQGSRLEDKRELYWKDGYYIIFIRIILVIITYYICERYQNVIPKQCTLEALYLNNVLLKEIVPKQCAVEDRCNCMGIQLKEF